MSSWRGRLNPFRNVAVARKRYRADAPSPDTNEENKEFDRAIAEFLLLGLDVGFRVLDLVLEMLRDQLADGSHSVIR
jgi:hypothetical protein